MSAQRSPDAVLSESEIEALKMNQGIINRMAENSRKTKNLYLTGCAALTALYKIDATISSLKIFIVFITMSCTLWYLDTRYLLLERQFRKHHNAIVHRELRCLEQWNFTPGRYSVGGLYSAMFSFSVLLYPICILVCIFLFFPF